MISLIILSRKGALHLGRDLVKLRLSSSQDHAIENFYHIILGHSIFIHSLDCFGRLEMIHTHILHVVL